jgi:hypothetical protein
MKEIISTAINMVAAVNHEPPHRMVPGVELVIVTFEPIYSLQKNKAGEIEQVRIPHFDTFRFSVSLGQLLGLARDFESRVAECAPIFEAAVANYVVEKAKTETKQP